MPITPVYCRHLTILGNPKKVIFNSIIHIYFKLFTLSQNKTNCYAYPLPTTPEKCHHTTLHNVQLFHLTEGMLHSSKRWWLWNKPVVGWHYWLWKEPVVMCGNCRASNITANVQSDHRLHGYILPVLNLHWSTVSSTTLCWNSTHVSTRRFCNSSISQTGTRYVWKNEKDEEFAHFTRYCGDIFQVWWVCFLLR